VSWERVRGHEALIEAFARAVRRGRLAHAYLFVGPEGVGKRTFAVELAKALLCESPADDGSLRACDKCHGCIQVEAETHPDFIAVARPEESLEFPVELMREVCQRFALKSARGRSKVVLLDDADDLNEESANCFLKTLEEPPPRSVLILIGSSPDRQLPTIVSRCQVVRFAPLPDGLVRELLQAQGVDDPTMLTRLARLGGGSPGQAKALADPALWEFRRTFLQGLTEPRIDSVRLSKAWMDFVEEAGKESAAQRRRASHVLRLLIDFLTDALTLSVDGAPRRTEPDDRRALEALAGRVGPDRLLELLERCLESDQQMDRRVQLVLILEALLDALGQKMSA
jgi:DNA polymerase-3 subunit delta'